MADGARGALGGNSTAGMASCTEWMGMGTWPRSSTSGWSPSSVAIEPLANSVVQAVPSAVLASKLDRTNAETSEPGYFAWRAGIPAIDYLVTRFGSLVRIRRPSSWQRHGLRSRVPRCAERTPSPSQGNLGLALSLAWYSCLQRYSTSVRSGRVFVEWRVLVGLIPALLAIEFLRRRRRRTRRPGS